MSRVILFNKPFRVMSQFREAGDKVNLSAFFNDKTLRIAGWLEFGPEGLMVLSDDGALVQKITRPKFKAPKAYWAQVEGEPDESALQQLRNGVRLKDGMTQPDKIRVIPEQSNLWP